MFLTELKDTHLKEHRCKFKIVMTYWKRSLEQHMTLAKINLHYTLLKSSCILLHCILPSLYPCGLPVTSLRVCEPVICESVSCNPVSLQVASLQAYEFRVCELRTEQFASCKLLAKYFSSSKLRLKHSVSCKVWVNPLTTNVPII